MKIQDERQEVELCSLCMCDERARAIMEELRKISAKVFGVTVVGPHVTLRFGNGERLVQVSMIVTSITDSTILEEPDYDDDK